MTIVSQGSTNLTALVVPDLIVQILPPDVTLLNGVPTNVLGLVGTASWGPVNSPVLFGDMSGYAQAFGAIQARKYDMGTAVAAAVLQGANNFRGIRVTDGTDTAATAALGLTGTAVIAAAGTGYVVGNTITLNNGAVLTVATVSTGAVATFTVTTQPTTQPTNPATQVATTGTGTGATFTFTYAKGATVTAKYTGTLGNSVSCAFSAGSQASTKKLTVSIPNRVPEVFDNITGTGNAFWVNLCNALAVGQSSLRGPSRILNAVVSTGTTAPANASTVLAGGTDGAGVSASNLLGVDGTPRTGMYALRATGVSVAALIDLDDSTTFSEQVAFGLSEGVYMIATGPAGETISSAATNKATAGVDTYAMKVLLGDWCLFNDTVNGQQRLISPQGYVAGRLANLSPEQSGLNKPIYGIVATQRTLSNQVYSAAELQAIGSAGIDVITNPVPGGDYFGMRFGRNASSSVVIHGDNYTRLTNYLASTFNSGLGMFLGRLQSPDMRREAKSTLEAFLQGNADQGMIGNAQGTIPFSVQIDDNNNPPNRVAQGVMQANVRVQYFSVIEFFVVNLTAGQSVEINRVQTIAA